jgi:hypothetical protein
VAHSNESDRAHWNRKVRAEQGLAARQALAHDLLRQVFYRLVDRPRG